MNPIFLSSNFLSFLAASTRELIKDINIEAVYIFPISEDAISPGAILSSTKFLYTLDLDTFFIQSLS